MYCYEDEKKKLFTEENQLMFLEIRDRVKILLDESGAFSMGKAIVKSTGDSYLQMACVHRLEEIGEIEEVPRGGGCAGHDRIFVKPGHSD